LKIRLFCLIIYQICCYFNTYIKDTAEALGITNLTETGALILASDVEFRLKELIQDAAKFMFHSKRTVLTMADIRHALRLRGVEPVYGYSPSSQLDFFKVTENKQDLFYQDVGIISFENFIQSTLPSPPEISYKAHWLSKDSNDLDLKHNPVDSIKEGAPILRYKRETNESSLLSPRRSKFITHSNLVTEAEAINREMSKELAEFQTCYWRL